MHNTYIHIHIHILYIIDIIYTHVIYIKGSYGTRADNAPYENHRLTRTPV